MLNLSDFKYILPQELIAQHPLEQRDNSRLLYSSPHSISNHRFFELHKVLGECFNLSEKKKCLLIANDSRVYPARVRIQRQTGARGEVFLLETQTSLNISCLLRPLSKLKVGEILFADGDLQSPLFEVTSLHPPQVSIAANCSLSLNEILEKHGEMPLPPYIDRDPHHISKSSSEDYKALDKNRYQTVYSNQLGSAAAPTAGLHFTDTVMELCRNHHIEFAYVTLHVGLGTFAPVQSENIEEHDMHAEMFTVSSQTVEKILEYQEKDWPVIFVGTTSLRTVESFFRLSQFSNKNSPDVDENKISYDFKNPTSTSSLLRQPYVSSISTHSKESFYDLADKWHATDLFIYPKDKNDKVNPAVGQGILTNFHQPESTLVMLISALVGYHRWQDIYTHALKEKYRFLSYGDSSLLLF